MKILMLVNWKVERVKQPLEDKQPPDFVAEGQPYWFYRYFEGPVTVDVLDIGSLPAIEKFEREKLRFYVLQAFRAVPKMYRYDLIVSHGMQSGVVISLWRRFFPGKVRHIVFDIGSFNSAAECGGALKLMQFSSHSIDGIIYHTGTQEIYYRKHFPWIVPRSQFIRFGTDSVFFGGEGKGQEGEQERPFILCTGYHKRDWDTLAKAYALLCGKIEGKTGSGQVPVLKLIGKPEYSMPRGTELPDCAKLEVMPYIPVRQLMKETKQAVFCVLPLENFNYSFGQMTLLQQMALGKAVITARVPSMMDYVRDGNNALFYEPANENDLCGKMELLLKDEKLLRELERKAAVYVKDVHNEKKMALQIERFYREILMQNRTGQENS